MSFSQPAYAAFIPARPGDAPSPDIATKDMDLEQDAEVEAARLTMPYMAQLQRMHPSWMAAFDDAQADEASLTELLGLLKTAPTEFARGVVFGKLSLRAQERACEHARVAL